MTTVAALLTNFSRSYDVTTVEATKQNDDFTTLIAPNLIFCGVCGEAKKTHDDGSYHMPSKRNTH